MNMDAALPRHMAEDNGKLNDNTQPLDSAIYCLVQLGKLFDIAVDPLQVVHRHGKYHTVYEALDVARCAQRLGLRTQQVLVKPDRIELTPLPVMAKIGDSFYVVEQCEDGVVYGYCGKTQQSWHQSLDELKRDWPEEWILFSRQEETGNNQQKPFGYSWFIPSIKKFWPQFRNVIFVSLFIQLFAIVTPLLFQGVIDKVLVSRSLASLEVFAFAILVLAVFDPLFGLLRSWLFSHAASRINSELSSRLYQHLLGLPLNYFKQRQTGEIIARVREMDQIRSFLTGSALTFVLDLFFIGIFLALLFSYAYLLAWIVVGSLVLYSLFWLCITPVMRDRVQRTFEKNATNTAFLTEAVTGIETIKTSATEQQFCRHWEDKLSAYVKTSFKAATLGIWAGQGIGLIQKITAALTLWFGVDLVMTGDLSVGGLVAFNMLAGHVTMPILRLAQIWQDFQQTGVSLRRVGDILNAPVEAVGSGKSTPPAIKGDIELRKVTFRYQDNGPEVLRRLDLSINAGEMIGITGLSGSGKSTITKLVQRLYVPESGQVLIDGMDLAVTDPVVIRQKTGVVLQESFLFNGSVKDNITLAYPEATEEEVIHAAKLAGAHDFIMQLAQGYETPVGERGGSLSGGQRQRIAIARALITNPSILIFDEATSALDYESESVILAQLPEIAKGRTLIMIAHRLNTLQQCDNIIVLEKGQILEQGLHQQLIDLEGRYSQLWKLQTGKSISLAETL